MAIESKGQGATPRLIAKIIASYVSHHNLAPEQIPELISSVHRTFRGLGQPVEPAPALTPAVSVRRSVQRDVVTCLDCGWRGKMLRRHLTTRHGLSGEDYLKRWGLPADHPLTAPNYSAQRSTLAKELGLGRGRGEAADDIEPEAAMPEAAMPEAAMPEAAMPEAAMPEPAPPPRRPRGRPRATPA